MQSVSVLMKPASGQCNMACEYCFYCDESTKREQASYGVMSEDTLRNIIRKTMAHAELAVSYAYQGGEPTLRGLDFYKKAVEYQNQYNRKGIAVGNAFQTNGLLIDGKWCHFFAENQFLVGLSVDGVSGTHDCYRHDRQGNGTYERVKHAADLMDSYGVNYNILTVVNQNVASHIAEIYQSYKENGWKYQQYIACLDPLGEGHGKNVYSILPGQYGEFLTELFEIWYDDWEKGKAPYIRQFDNYIGILMGYQPEACDQKGSCGTYHVVEADGSVYPCDFYMLDQFLLGNFNDNSFVELEERRKQSDFKAESEKENPECAKCSYHSLCKGGCFRHRDKVLGQAYYANYFCESYRFFFSHCYEKMQQAALKWIKNA